MKLMPKIMLGFFSVCLVSVLGFVYIIINLGNASDLGDKLKLVELPRTFLVYKITENFQRQVSLFRAYVAYGNENDIVLAKKLYEENDKLYNELIKHAQNEKNRERYKKMYDLDSKYSNIFFNKLYPELKSGNHDSILNSTTEMRAYIDDLDKVAIETQTSRANALTRSMDTLEDVLQSLVIVSIFIAVLSLVLGLSAGYFLARSICKPIKSVMKTIDQAANGDLTVQATVTTQDELGIMTERFNKMLRDFKKLISVIHGNSQSLAASSEELTANASQSALASQQVANSIVSVSQGADKQLLALSKTNELIQSISLVVESANTSAGQASISTTSATQKAAAGRIDINKAIVQMDVIVGSAMHMAEVINRLGASSQEISKILDSIYSIASQTNLLALNAAIEASRAGSWFRRSC